MVVQANCNNLSNFRAGFTATKKIGGAVVRNTCKRRMREAAREALEEFGIPGIDYVFIARKFTHKIAWRTLLEEIKFATKFLSKKISLQ